MTRTSKCGRSPRTRWALSSGQLLNRWKTTPDELRTNQPLVSTTTRALLGLLNDRNDAVKSEALRALVAIHFHRNTRSGFVWGLIRPTRLSSATCAVLWLRPSVIKAPESEPSRRGHWETLVRSCPRTFRTSW